MFNKWIESAKTLLNLYKKLAELRIKGKENTDEYNLILSLLENAVKYENDKIEKITFNDETIGILYDLILEHISIDNPLNVDEMLTDNDALVYARIHNIVEAIDYDPSESKSEDITVDNIIDYLAVKYIEEDERDIKFNHFFQTYVCFNIIYIINLAIEKMKDKKAKEFLIKLLFSNIYVNPTYEEYFKKSMVIAKPINIANYLFELVNEKYSKDEIMNDIMYNLVDFTIDEIEMELNKKDKDLLDTNEYFEYLKNMTDIMGKLISLMDASIIDQVETKIKELIEAKNRKDNIRIVNDITRMFSESRTIIAKHNKERGLKYGKTTKETN